MLLKSMIAPTLQRIQSSDRNQCYIENLGKYTSMWKLVISIKFNQLHEKFTANTWKAKYKMHNGP